MWSNFQKENMLGGNQNPDQSRFQRESALSSLAENSCSQNRDHWEYLQLNLSDGKTTTSGKGENVYQR